MAIFGWDGTFIGDIEHHIRAYASDKEKRKTHFAFVHTPGVSEYAQDITMVIIARFKNLTPVIADELKPLFGLQKLGRHYGCIGNKKVLISRCIYGTDEPFSSFLLYRGIPPSPKPMKNINVDDIKYMVRRVYIYRWALGLTLNHDASLWVRRPPVTAVSPVITSWRETGIVTEPWKVSNRIPNTGLKRWFDNDWKQVNITLTQMVNEGSRQQSTTPLINLRFEIEDIIRRIDQNYLGWSTFIISRLHEKYNY